VRLWGKARVSKARMQEAKKLRAAFLGFVSKVESFPNQKVSLVVYSG
jgi:hypothetical protein